MLEAPFASLLYLLWGSFQFPKKTSSNAEFDRGKGVKNFASLRSAKSDWKQVCAE